MARQETIRPKGASSCGKKIGRNTICSPIHHAWVLSDLLFRGNEHV
jgi:hypothetical protein